MLWLNKLLILLCLLITYSNIIWYYWCNSMIRYYVQKSSDERRNSWFPNGQIWWYEASVISILEKIEEVYTNNNNIIFHDCRKQCACGIRAALTYGFSRHSTWLLCKQLHINLVKFVFSNVFGKSSFCFAVISIKTFFTFSVPYVLNWY